MGQNLIRVQDLEDNPTARVPVCLCLDVSGSMNIIIPGTGRATNEQRVIDGQRVYIAEGGVSRLDEMQKGIESFYETVRSDPQAHDAAEICVVTFGAGGAHIACDFARVDRQTVPRLSADGETPMGEAVNLALDCLEQRKKEFKEAGVDYFQPWLVLMTDGVPNGNQQALEQAITRTRNLANANRLTVFPMAVSEEADLATLSRFSPKRPPAKLKNMNFKDFFEWLGKSVQQLSNSVPGEKPTLPHDNVDTWWEI